jgi:hypothetical protein
LIASSSVVALHLQNLRVCESESAGPSVSDESECSCGSQAGFRVLMLTAYFRQRLSPSEAGKGRRRTSAGSCCDRFNTGSQSNVSVP